MEGLNIYEQAFQYWNLSNKNFAVESQIAIAIIVYALITFQQVSVLLVPNSDLTAQVKDKGKVHPCTDTEVLYRPYGP